MPSSPGTVSKILWHFTGGPNWNEAEKRQEDKPKPTEDAYAALIAILKSHELRIGQYKEVVKTVIPKIQTLDLNTAEMIEDLNVARTLVSAPVCCLADIPIIHLGYHADRYGKFAVGFHRDAAIHHGFNPVFYLLQDSRLLQSIYIGLHMTGGINDREIELATELVVSEMTLMQTDVPIVLDDMVDGMSSKLTKSLEILNKGIEAMIERLNASAANVKKGISHMRTILAFIKTFEPDEFGTIYCEREWRSIKPFKFKYDDISMIALPRSKGSGDYFERFVEEAKSIPLPPTVSIVPWDDMVEH